jgi:hypothetical protein
MITQCELEGTADKAIMDCFKIILHAGLELTSKTTENMSQNFWLGV